MSQSFERHQSTEQIPDVLPCEEVAMWNPLVHYLEARQALRRYYTAEASYDEAVMELAVLDAAEEMSQKSNRKCTSLSVDEIERLNDMAQYQLTDKANQLTIATDIAQGYITGLEYIVRSSVLPKPKCI